MRNNLFVFSLIEKQIVLYARSDELTLAQWGFPGNAFELLQTSSFTRYIPNFQSSWYGVKVGRKFCFIFFSNSTSEKLWSYWGWAAFHVKINECIVKSWFFSLETYMGQTTSKYERSTEINNGKKRSTKYFLKSYLNRYGYGYRFSEGFISQNSDGNFWRFFLLEGYKIKFVRKFSLHFYQFIM